MKALLDGRAEEGEWITSRALHYGDGVFRTALVVDGRVIDLDRQIAKLAADARWLGLDARGADLCARDAKRLARRTDRAVIKMLLWRKGGRRGYRPDSSATARLVTSSELPAAPRKNWLRGVRAFRSPMILGSQPRLAGIKHLNRLEQVLASDGWPRGVDEAILCDAGGRPIGGTKSNLFWIARGRLYTPLLDACGVAGVMRQKVLEVAQRLGVPWRIGAFAWRDFIAADEAFLTNSLIGIWPVRQCETQRWHAPGRLTRRLSEALAHPWTGA